MAVYVIHENDEWLVPLRQAFKELEIPFLEWHLGKGGSVDLSAPPPEGIFFNRISASSHTRDHRYACEHTHAVLEWLEYHNARVVNGTRALRLEISKVRQYVALERLGIQTPKTVVCSGSDDDVHKQLFEQAAKHFPDCAFITKHNRAGKGLGVRKFGSAGELKFFLKQGTHDEPVDGITLLQKYIDSPDGSITRCEFVGGQFMYAVKVETGNSFELCPADHCQIDQFCPAGNKLPQSKVCFTICSNNDEWMCAHREQIESYEAFLAANRIEVAGIEFIEDADGQWYTYDVNTNTNYNLEAEEAAFGGMKGMKSVAAFLGRELEQALASQGSA